MKKSFVIASVVATVMATSAWAATPAAQETTQRDINQQDRIERGLQSGQLNTREAGKLEKDEAHIDRMESRDLKDGKLTPKETAQINRTQNRVSNQIYQDKHNTSAGNPNSASSERMQKDAQRNINQESRIKQGEASGTLTNREAGRLERGQAHVDRREGAAGANGHVGAAEQRGIQRSENRQSRRVFRKKHNAVG
jgi:hypothetical protein